MWYLFFTFALLASAITSNKLILSQLPPILSVAIRMLSAGAILWILTTAHGKKITWSEIKAHLPLLLVITLCTSYIPVICKSIALKYLPSSTAAFFGSLDPFITAIYSYFLFGEELNSKQILGVCIAIVGSLILLNPQTAALSTIPSFEMALPYISAFLAIAIGRYGWILAQMLLKKETFSPIQLNSISMLASGVLSLITSVSLESFSQIHITDYKSVSLYILYTVIVGNVLSLTMYASLLKVYSATLVSLVGFSVPLFVHMYGWLILDEPISVRFFVALICTLIGFALFLYNKNNSRMT